MAPSTIPLRTLGQLRAHGYGISLSCDNDRCTRRNRHAWLDLDAAVAEHGAGMDIPAFKARLRCSACGAPGGISIISDGKPIRR